VSYAVLFPGQGSQFEGMADGWMEHPAGRQVLDRASELLGRDVVAGCHDVDALRSTGFVQPALLACGLSAFAVLRAEGADEPAGAAGHSLGEFAALVAAEVLTFEDALDIVIVRGEAMQRAGEERPGTMAALVGLDEAEAAGLVEEARQDDVLVVANLNSPVQVVVSGSVAAVQRLETIAKERKVRLVRLSVAGAFHSALMEPAVEPIVERLDAVAFLAPRFPIAENVSGTLVEDPDELKGLLKRHVVSPVRWEACARALAGAGADTFLEAGPGDVLTKLQKRIDPGVRALAIGDTEAARAALTG
jgi:[acyl-carrier-protein] S-malonyltransferase